jgi:hypothetical protein
MKLTKSQLKQIIKEEIQGVLREQKQQLASEGFLDRFTKKGKADKELYSKSKDQIEYAKAKKLMDEDPSLSPHLALNKVRQGDARKAGEAEWAAGAATREREADIAARRARPRPERGSSDKDLEQEASDHCKERTGMGSRDYHKGSSSYQDSISKSYSKCVHDYMKSRQ